MGSVNFATQVPIGLSSVCKLAPFTTSRLSCAFGSSAGLSTAALAYTRGSGSLPYASPINASSVENRFESLYASASMPLATQTPAVAQKAAEADVMGLLLQQRIVFLGSSLDDFTADAIISQLLLLDAQDPAKDIRLFINSSGGSMSAAMGVFDAIQLCRAPVSTIAFGFAASTAAILLAAGSKGKRLAMPNARIMLHQPMGGASGQAIDVEIQAKEIMHHKTNITRILSQITGRTYEQVEEDIDRDRYLSPLEAVEYGILDGVIDEDAIIPLVPASGKVTRRSEYKDAESDPRKFLIPVIPDDEIY
eukprot:c15798_g1_i1 orf=153-1073(+)